jgi:hypothetical protein
MPGIPRESEHPLPIPGGNGGSIWAVTSENVTPRPGNTSRTAAARTAMAAHREAAKAPELGRILERIGELASAVDRAEAWARTIRAMRDEEIRRGVDAGGTWGEVARAARLSKGPIGKLLHPEGFAPAWDQARRTRPRKR